MRAKEIGRRFKLAREFAQRIADRCDFIMAESIGKAPVSFGEDFAIVGVDVKDNVEVAQVMCAFVYGATMAGLSFERSALEDVEHDGVRTVIMTLKI